MYAFIDTGGPNSGFSCMPCVFLKLRSSIRPGSLRVHKFAVSWTALFFFWWCDGICWSHSFSLGATAANAAIITGTTLPFGFHFCSSFFLKFLVLLCFAVCWDCHIYDNCSLVLLDNHYSVWLGGQPATGWMASNCLCGTWRSPHRTLALLFSTTFGSVSHQD